VLGRSCVLPVVPAIPAPGCIPFDVLVVVVVAAVEAGGLAGSDGCSFSLPFPLSTGGTIGFVVFAVFAVNLPSAVEAEPPPCTSRIISSTPFSKSISVSSPPSLSSCGPGDPEPSLDPGADVCNGEFCIEAILASSAAIWAFALRYTQETGIYHASASTTFSWLKKFEQLERERCRLTTEASLVSSTS